MGKFNIGDTVFHVGLGWAKVMETGDRPYPIVIEVEE